LKRLRLPEDSREARIAGTVWDETLVLAQAVFFRLPLSKLQFMDRFGAYVAQSPYMEFRLRECRDVWLFAATLGPAPEERAEELFTEGRVFEGYVMDFFGTWLVDRVMRHAITSIKAGPGALTVRLMPGAHGFSLGAQAVFVDLAGQALGLSLTSGYGLVPRKSVTAVVGRLSYAPA